MALESPTLVAQVLWVGEPEAMEAAVVVEVEFKELSGT
jgi:hypothetical protein